MVNMNVHAIAHVPGTSMEKTKDTCVPGCMCKRMCVGVCMCVL